MRKIAVYFVTRPDGSFMSVCGLVAAIFAAICPPLLACPIAFGIKPTDIQIHLHGGEFAGRLRPSNTSNSQGQALVPGQIVERRIMGTDTHVLRVSLAPDQQAEVVFEWREMDLDVHVLKPDGNRLDGSATQVRGSRSLPLTLIADASGGYLLKVHPVEKLNISGTYSARLEILQTPTLIDRKRVDAQRLMNAAQDEADKSIMIQKLNQALELWNEAGDLQGAAYTLRLLGRQHLVPEPANENNSTKLLLADQYFGRAIELARTRDQKQFAYTLIEIGSDHEALVSAARALKFYHQALPVFKNIQDRAGESVALYRIGLAEARVGYMREALKWYEQAIVIQREERDRLGEAKTLNAMGGAYGVLAEQDQAVSFYQQAAPIWEELNDRYRQAITLKNIGVVYDDWGDLQTARRNYLESLSIIREMLGNKNSDGCSAGMRPEDSRSCNSIANTLDNIGELYNSLGETQTALATLQEGLAIRRTLKQPQGIGATLSRIAYAYLLENNPSEALKYCDEALPYSKGSKDLRKWASILTFKGMAYTAQNKPDEAIKFYQEALRMQEETGEKRGTGVTLDQMGRAYALKGDLDHAFQSYQRALTIWQEIKDQEWEPRTLYNIAHTERQRGDLDRAHEQIAKALQIVESRRASLSSRQLRTSYFANKNDIYELDIDVKMQLSKTKGTEHARSALETSERAKARTLTDTLHEAWIDHRSEDGSKWSSDPKLAELVAQKRILQGKLNAKGLQQTTLLGGKYTQEQAKAISNEIVNLTNQYDELKTQISAHNPRYAGLTQPSLPKASELQQILNDETLVLEYSLGDKRSYLWTMALGSIKGFELPGRDDIEKVSRRMTEALTARNREVKDESFEKKDLRVDKAEKDYVEASAALTTMVLEPVASLLGRKRLVIVADGALQTVPFGALPVPGGPEPLMGEHEIVYLPSASVLALQRRELANRKPGTFAVAVLADPVFDDQDPRVAKAMASQPRNGPPKQARPGSTSAAANAQSLLSRALRDVGLDGDGKMPRLTQSRREAKAISLAVGADQSFSALDFKANRQTATSSELSKYRIIHFATHGVMDVEHPELSGIVLSMVDEKGQPQDGYLRLHEIYNLNLPAELVVLSACQTGVGKQIKGEGLIALTRGFMYAGAKSIVASLWKVDDAATSALMAEFYKQMFVNKLKPSAALRQAQLKISKEKRWQSPYYWAGFFLQGEWK